ncbi:hypothetical protein [Paenibacillus lautus]|uniref:hypothetical protein n=1 Tax=Paenibacillus lautus TaxID=1401 RepID=UPI001C7CC306|nr:hypothetical protein [Paenibacillus lautus]MBX4151085.1 hypothetical protein [Paenibacillus lautus]
MQKKRAALQLPSYPLTSYLPMLEVILDANDAAQHTPFNRLIPFEFPYLTPGFNGPQDYLLHLADETPGQSATG